MAINNHNTNLKIYLNFKRSTDSVFVSLRRTTAAAASETAIRMTAIGDDDNPR